jgi:peptidyl-prolyl cis-trans isomerase A (cyclophilin A)
MRLFSLLATGGAMLLLAGCSSSSSSHRGPDRYRVKFETSRGDFIVDCMREWSPLGADRFHELVTSGFYDGARFYRVVPGFVIQFGFKGDPSVDGVWRNRVIDDDPPGVSNTPATMSFATSGARSRTTQVFINLGDNRRLDSMGFTPFGRVTEGMSNAAAIFPGYGEQPQQPMIEQQGNAYLQANFPNLDYVKKAAVLP